MGHARSASNALVVWRLTSSIAKLALFGKAYKFELGCEIPCFAQFDNRAPVSSSSRS